MNVLLFVLLLIPLACAHPWKENPRDSEVDTEQEKQADFDIDEEQGQNGTLNKDLLPPKWHPGDVMREKHGQLYEDINAALDDVMRAGGLLKDRRCAIGTANKGGGRTFINPQYYLYSGMIVDHAPYSFINAETGLKLFIKTDWAARGTVGTVAYDIENSNHKLAIMWSVPYDFNLYKVWYITKIYPKSEVIDKELWNNMYYYAGPWEAMGYRDKTEYGIHMHSTMSDNTHSKIIVWVDTTNYNPNGQPDLHTDCSYHPWWFGSYCWQECTRGWCWVDRKCSSAADCQGGPLPCYTGC